MVLDSVEYVIMTAMSLDTEKTGSQDIAGMMAWVPDVS